MFCYFLIAALIPAMALATNVAPCIGGEPFPTAVRVAGCEIVPCFIVKGEDAIMEMDFTVGDTVITKLTPTMTAYALGQVVVYPLPDEIQDVCSNLGTSQCPLDPTEEVTWNFLFSVGLEYPLIDLRIEAKLTDQDKNIVGCFSLEAIVIDDF